MHTPLLSTLQQLNIQSLTAVCDYSAQYLAKNFTEKQLERLNNAFRDYLWQAELLPAKLNELNQQCMPIEALGLPGNIQRLLKNDDIHTVAEFIQRDKIDYLSAKWNLCDRLAVRTRIFCLLMLSTEQLNELKTSASTLADNPATGLPVTISSTDHPKSRERRLRKTYSIITPQSMVVPDDEEDIGNSQFLHQPWLKDWFPDDFSPAYPDIEKFLFENVYQLPIITSRRHEIWIGAQMEAGKRLQEIIKCLDEDLVSPIDVFSTVYVQLYSRWQSLESICVNNHLPLPNCAIWISEIQSVRADFYNVTRSRFRYFLKSIEDAECEAEVRKDAVNAAFDSFEILWMLPGSALPFVAESSQKLKGGCPPVVEFAAWLGSNQDLASDLAFLRQQDLIARNRLISGYFRAALKFARRYVEEEGLDYLDLVQEGAIGLIQAAARYNYREEARFIQYATSWMWQTTSRAIADLSRNIRVPVHRQEQFRQFEKAYKEWLNEQGEPPTTRELSFYSGYLSEAEIIAIQNHINDETELLPNVKARWDTATAKTEQALEYIEPTISLSTEIPADLIKDNLILEDLIDPTYPLAEVIYHQKTLLDIPTTGEGLEEKQLYQDLKAVLLELCDRLSVRQGQVIKLRFGLEDSQEYTLEEIGQQFGVTRERIRQIEARAIKILAHPTRKRRLKIYLDSLEIAEPLQWRNGIIAYIRQNHSYWSKFNLLESSREQSEQSLDSLIEKLPGVNWHHRSVTRGTQVEDALKTLGVPAHYIDITEQLNDILENEDLEKEHVYQILSNNEKIFVPLGEGVFSLIEWERKRSYASEPILPFCPMPLPDLPGQSDTFLESVLIARDFLKTGPTTSEFLHNMLQWVGSDVVSPWFKQNILNAYYLVGLIPYTFHFESENPVLYSTLPGLDLHEMRRYCLQSLTKRLTAMPELWWIIRQYQPGTSTDFAQHFLEVHPLELNDVLNRLRLLSGLGAVQRLSYNRYELTSLGQLAGQQWAREPRFNKQEEIDEPETQDMFNFFDLELW